MKEHQRNKQQSLWVYKCNKVVVFDALISSGTIKQCVDNANLLLRGAIYVFSSSLSFVYFFFNDQDECTNVETY